MATETLGLLQDTLPLALLRNCLTDWSQSIGQPAVRGMESQRWCQETEAAMMPAGHVALQDLFRMLCLMAGTDQLLLLRINWSRMGKSLNTLFCKSGLKNNGLGYHVFGG